MTRPISSSPLAGGDAPPATPITPPPLFVWPPRPDRALGFLFGIPGYFLPLNGLYMLLAIVTWFALTPDLARMTTLEPGWIGGIYLRNLAFTIFVFGGLHLRFYTLGRQGTRYMLNRRSPTGDGRQFLFGNQVRENMFWTLVSGVGIWTAYEVLTLWAFANGFIPMLDWNTHPVWFVLLFCAIPLIRDAHFYLVHRLLHTRWLYRPVHALHHKNVDIGPWSGMSMHPVEHLLYLSGVLLHWVVLSHPLHAIFHLQQTGLAPALGHVGFHKLETKEGKVFPIGQRLFHFLHHRSFECNYGGDGTVPIDKWFGSWHDGTEAGEAHIRERRRRAALG